LNSQGMVRTRLKYYVFLVLISIAVFFSLNNIVSSNNLNEITYYWLKKNVYFKYSLYDRSKAPIVFILNTHKENIRVSSYNWSILWRVLNVDGKYIVVNYTLEASEAEIVNISSTKTSTYTLKQFTIARKYLIDIETLDVYSVDKGNNKMIWVGEWPFLLQPLATVKKSVKLLYLMKVNVSVSIDDLKDLANTLEKVNETVINVTNGAKVYKPLIKGERARLSDKIVVFTVLNPPPTKYSFKIKDYVISGDRIVNGKGEPFWIPDDAKEAFNKLYNSSNRPIRFYEGVTAGYVRIVMMVDPSGDVYVQMSIGRLKSIYYDAITGVLLYMNTKSENDLYMLIGFKDMVFYDNIRVGVYHGEKDIVVKLVDTNIDFNRPVFGATSLTESPTRTTNISYYSALDLLPYLNIIMVLFIIIYIVYRVKLGKS